MWCCLLQGEEKLVEMSNGGICDASHECEVRSAKCEYRLIEAWRLAFADRLGYFAPVEAAPT
ncbi:hypothetical protein BSIN_4140 [Burkholderia singularis]|uniref:Uncharacterized protein n=1 Tax=Burkholderia singularis TaxID=1503053 RepID=A0A238H780_9BURK|nr:hypothetical protein BSIN_4140 [Burkholderia singularis]